MPRPLLPVAAALALATGCAEDSSFVLRWQVGRTAKDAEEKLTSVRQCSELGLGYVRVTTIDSDGAVVDTREFPCFPDEFRAADGAAPGPELSAGVYAVSVVGLTRRDQPRPDPDDPDAMLASDHQTVTVHSKGEGQLVTGFRLIGIDECADGVDNDRDGAVDLADAPCRNGQAREDLDLSGALFTFRATLLGGENPYATCDHLGLASFRVTLDDDAAGARTIACTTVSQSFSADLAAGEHTWKVEGLDKTGEVVTDPLLAPAAFLVEATGFVVVPIEVDFSIASFSEDTPFQGPLSFSLEYAPRDGAALNRPCDPAGLQLGDLVLGTTRVTLITDVAPPMPILLDDQPLPVTDQCSAFDSIRTIEDLAWSSDPSVAPSSYSLQVESWAVGDDPDVDEPCFSNKPRDGSSVAPEPLAPNINIPIVVPRLRSDGACADCVPPDPMDPTPPKDDNCARCEAGVCVG